MKITKKEIAVALALTLTIAALSVLQSVSLRRSGFEGYWGLEKAEIVTQYGLSAAPSERVRIMDANIQGVLRAGCFEMLVPAIEDLVWGKGGFIVTERLTFKDGLWTGEIVSKLPPINASAFTIEVRQKIDENGRVMRIEIEIRDFVLDPSVTASEQYSTIRIFLNEELEGVETLEPFIQLGFLVSILTTGLVWIAGGLIVGVPLCFVSLGIVMLVKRVIIPLWKRELSQPS